MEFWRIYRLVFAKRFLIAMMMVIAGAVILIGTSLTATKRDFEAEATLQPQESALEETAPTNTNGAGSSQANSAADNQAQISDLIIFLRTSTDLYDKTADLLREDESMRAIDVEQILERNGYFASLDNGLENQARQLVEDGSKTQDAADKWLADEKKSARKKEADALARASDGSGAYAAAGLNESVSQIVELIRTDMSFDTVPGPLSTDNNPQIANQIKVSAKFDREAQSILFTNMLCVEFLDYYTNQRASSVNTRIANLAEKLREANGRLAKDRAQEVTYRRSNPVAPYLDTLVAQATNLQTTHDAAEAELSSDQATVEVLQGSLAALRDTNTHSLPIGESPTVRAAQIALNEAQIAFDAVAASNEGAANNDKYIAAKARLDTAKQLLTEAKAAPYTSTTVSNNQEEMQNRLTAAIALRDATQSRLGALSAQLAEKQVELTKLPATQARLQDLEREIRISEQNVQNLETEKLHEEMLNITNSKAGTISIVSQAHITPTVNTVATQRIKLVVYGMILALIFGVALVIAMEVLDTSIRTSLDVEKLTGLPVAGIIPEHLSDPVRSPKITLLEPLSSAAEAYRLLRTDLFFTAADHPFQSLVMATSRSGQGATTTICNLAIVLAQYGRRVILVDGDIRQPKLHHIFGKENRRGLTDVLGGLCTLDEALLPTEVDGMLLLPAGQFVYNPSDILGSAHMQALHEQLKSMADYVLIDTPSAIAFSDTAILSSFVDAALMVVRANGVPHGTEEQVKSMLNKARANLIGAVLNGVTPDDVDSVHYSAGAIAALPPTGANASGGGSGARIVPLAAPLATPVAVSADEEEAIPLPGAVGAGATAASATDSHPTAGAWRAPVTGNGAPALVRSAGPAFASGAGPGGVAAHHRPAGSLRPWVLLGVAAAVLGLLVLLLGNGANVK